MAPPFLETVEEGVEDCRLIIYQCRRQYCQRFYVVGLELPLEIIPTVSELNAVEVISGDDCPVCRLRML